MLLSGGVEEPVMREKREDMKEEGEGEGEGEEDGHYLMHVFRPSTVYAHSIGAFPLLLLSLLCSLCCTFKKSRTRKKRRRVSPSLSRSSGR